MDSDSASEVLILTSGGIDSSLCISRQKASGLAVRCLHVDFGQPAANEEWAALQRIVKFFEVPCSQICVRSSQVFAPGEVEGRNAFLVLTALMFRHPTERLICLGIHSGTPYYDCSPGFLASIDKMIAEHTNSMVRVIAPLLGLHKPDIVAECRSNDVPIQLTYSCQLGLEIPCGKCLSCKDRSALGC